MKFDKIVEDIKKLKIQSAENVAKNALLAIQDYSKNIDTLTKTKFIDELEKAKQILFQTRPTEPCMRNALNFVLNDLNSSTLSESQKKIDFKINQALQHLETAKDIVGEIGSRKIRNGSNIFTHCHSSFVISILKKAKQQGKNFTVHNTETRPRFQGRITASELSEADIPVVHYIDSSARLAIKKCDLMLLGADAIDSEGKIYNKIGSEMFAEIASKFEVPVYIATDSWKFDPKSIFGFNEEIEKRNPSEVWAHPPKNVKIENFAFEKIDPESISGIISELGVFNIQTFIDEIRSKYKFMFI